MRILVTGSAGHLGEALVRTLRAQGRAADRARHRRLAVHRRGRLDRRSRRSSTAACAASTRCCMRPRCTSRTWPRTARQAFVDTNITGTLNLLEAACATRRRRVRVHQHHQRVRRRADAAARRAGGVDHRGRDAGAEEHLRRRPRPPPRTCASCSIATSGCRAWCCAPRASFRSPTTKPRCATSYATATSRPTSSCTGAWTSQDVVDAHLLAMERAPALGFGRYIISATTPFGRDDAEALRRDAAAVLARRVPGYEAEYARRGWRMFPGIERVYVNARRARRWAGGRATILLPCWQICAPARTRAAQPGARVGVKGYHGEQWRDGLYPVD